MTARWPLAEGRQCDRKAATTVPQKSTLTTQYLSTCVPRTLYLTAQGLTSDMGEEQAALGQRERPGQSSTALCWQVKGVELRY